MIEREGVREREREIDENHQEKSKTAINLSKVEINLHLLLLILLGFDKIYYYLGWECSLAEMSKRSKSPLHLNLIYFMITHTQGCLFYYNDSKLNTRVINIHLQSISCYLLLYIYKLQANKKTLLRFSAD